MNGWIRLSRKLLEWQWHDEPNMMTLWVHILLRACHERTKYHGITTERGQLATSIAALAAATGLGRKVVMRCLRRLLDEESITVKGINGVGSIISIVNYDQYQLDSIEPSGGRFGTAPGTASGDSFGTGSGESLGVKVGVKVGDRFTNCQSSDCAIFSKAMGQKSGQSLGKSRAKDGDKVGVKDGVKVGDRFTDCQSDDCAIFSKAMGQKSGQNLGQWKGTRINNNNNIYPSSSSYAGAYAREAGCGTPPTGSGDGEADVGKQLQELLCDPAYSPIILMRSKMTAEEALAYIPEFVAQCRLRDKTWPSVRELTEHFANWLTRKQTNFNEQERNSNGAPPRGGDADERERHSAVVQTALGLMAGSTRDD